MADQSNLLMPKLGLTMTEGTITEWRVQPGEAFSAGQIVAVVETEKIANEVEAPASGVMKGHLVDGGNTVPVGTPIASWELGEGAPAAQTPAAQPEAKTKQEEAPKAAPPSPAPAAAPTAPKAAPAAAAKAAPAKRTGRIIATPLAKRIARETGVDLSTIAGSGPGGRIKAADVAKAPAPAGPASAARSASAQTDGFIVVDIKADELLSVLEKLSGLPDALPIEAVYLVGMAAAKALTQVPEANVIVSPAGAYETSDQASVRIGEAAVQDAARKTLRAIVEACEAISTDAGTASIAVVDGAAHGARYTKAAIPAGATSSLAVGAPQEIFRPGADRQPKLTAEIGLVLAFDRAAISEDTASALIGEIKNFLENPLRLLAG